MLQTSIEDCVFSTQNASSAVDCPHIYQPMARSRESTCACAAVTPSKAQAVRRLSGWNFLYAQHSFFFLEHSHSCVWQKPFIFTYIEFSFFSATTLYLYSYATMWRWITEIACKHVIFWISASQMLPDGSKLRRCCTIENCGFEIRQQAFFKINLLQVCWLNVYVNSTLIELFQHCNNFIFHLRPRIL